MRTAAVAALVLGLGLAGCAERWSYTKPGVTPSRLDQDLASCARQADRPYSFGLSHSARADQEKLNQCMERKGYAPAATSEARLHFRTLTASRVRT